MRAQIFNVNTFDAPFELMTWTELSPSFKLSFFDLPTTRNDVSDTDLRKSVLSSPLINTRESSSKPLPSIVILFFPSNVIELITGRSAATIS